MTLALEAGLEVVELVEPILGLWRKGSDTIDPLGLWRPGY